MMFETELFETIWLLTVIASIPVSLLGAYYWQWSGEVVIFIILATCILPLTLTAIVILGGMISGVVLLMYVFVKILEAGKRRKEVR